eukprot:403360355
MHGSEAKRYILHSNNNTNNKAIDQFDQQKIFQQFQNRTRGRRILGRAFSQTQKPPSRAGSSSNQYKPILSKNGQMQVSNNFQQHEQTQQNTNFNSNNIPSLTDQEGFTLSQQTFDKEMQERQTLNQDKTAVQQETLKLQAITQTQKQNKHKASIRSSQKMAQELQNVKGGNSIYNHYKHYDVLIDMAKPAMMVNSSQRVNHLHQGRVLDQNENKKQQQIFDYELQIYQKMIDYKKQHFLVGTSTTLQQNIEDKIKANQSKSNQPTQSGSLTNEIIVNRMKIPEITRLEGQKLLSQNSHQQKQNDKHFFSQNISPKSLPNINRLQVHEVQDDQIMSERQRNIPQKLSRKQSSNSYKSNTNKSDAVKKLSKNSNDYDLKFVEQVPMSHNSHLILPSKLEKHLQAIDSQSQEKSQHLDSPQNNYQDSFFKDKHNQNQVVNESEIVQQKFQNKQSPKSKNYLNSIKLQNTNNLETSPFKEKTSKYNMILGQTVSNKNTHLLADFSSESQYYQASMRNNNAIRGSQKDNGTLALTQNFADLAYINKLLHNSGVDMTGSVPGFEELYNQHILSQYQNQQQNQNTIQQSVQGLNGLPAYQLPMNRKNYLIGRVGNNPGKRSIHGKAFAGIIGPGGAGGANFMNQIKKGQLLQLYQSKQQGNLLFQDSSQFKNLGKGSNGSFYFNNNQNANPSLKKQVKLLFKYYFRDLMGFLEIQKMTMPTKDQASYSNINHLTQQQNLQQQQIHEQNQINGLLISIQNTQQKFKHIQQYNLDTYNPLQQSPSNYNTGMVQGFQQGTTQQNFKKQAHYYHAQQRSMQISQLDSETIQQCPPVLPLNPNYLKFVVLPGNNSRLIKEAMLRRGHKWIETFAQDPFYHFKWQPVSYGIKFEQISTPIVQGMHPCQKQLVNHFEFHSNLTEKSKLFKNLTQYSIKLRENVFDYMPLTYFVEIDDIGKMKGYAKAMLPFMNSFYALEDIKKKTIKYYIKVDEMKGSSSPTKVNQFQQETTENADDPFDEQFIFKHFYNNKRGLIKQHLKEEKESKEKTLKKHFFKYTMPFCHFSGHNLWLLKPTKLNRGRGIHVYNNLGMLKTLIFKYCEGFKKQNQTSATMKQLSLKIQDSNNANEACSTIIGTNNALTRMKQQAINNVETSPDKQNMLIENSQDLDEEDIVDPMDDLDSSPTQLKEKVSSEVNPKTLSNTIDKKQSATTASQVTQFKHNSFILQKYIERPLLIHQRKFDIRVWVIINYDSSCYMFKEGYLRTSSSEYGIDPNNPDDQYVHLTNNAIQKFSDNYGNFEDGNQMSYDAFQQYLDDKGYSVNVKKDLVFRMKQLIVRSIFATKHSLDPKQRKSCFELFGYDFIIDEDFNLWLIEVNTNPCIEESSNILKIYLPRMIDDMLKLSVDQFYQEFNPQQYFQSAKNEYQTIDEGFEEQKYTFPVNGYNDDENMWEYMCNIKDKKNRKEAKDQYFTPIQINSKYAFQIKDRQFKVKKYIQEQMPPNLNNNQKSHTDLNQLQQDSKSDSLNEGA